jgi:hypothetical protein
LERSRTNKTLAGGPRGRRPTPAPGQGSVHRVGAYPVRVGFLTSAARRGASVFKVRDVSRHKSMDVLQANVRDADLFRDYAGAGLL